MKVLKFLISITLAILLVGQGIADENKVTTENLLQDEIEVRITISDQIAAFSASDIDRAYNHASKSIKTIFPSSEIFGTMVRKSYPMIWSPKSYEFLSASHSPLGIKQRVLFTDKAGKMPFFDYVLENNGERWVISGVYMVEGEKGV